MSSGGPSDSHNRRVNQELQKQITILMVCRAFLLSALLVTGLIVGRLLDQPFLASQFFYLLIGAGFGLTIFYTLLHPFWSKSRIAAAVQIALDIVLVTGFVYVTGGLDSPFSLIYFLPIIAAGIMLGRAGAISSSTSAWVMYAFLVVLLVSGWIPSDPASLGGTAAEPSLDLASEASINKKVAYSLFSHFVGFFMVGHLSSYLVLKLKAAGDELAEKREAIAKIQALNKNIIDSITSGIVTTDLEGRITFLNRGAETITGIYLDQAEGADVTAFLGRENGFVDTLREKLESQRWFRFESSTLSTSGSVVHLGITSATLKDQRGTPLGFVFSFQDLTEIKTLEEEVMLKDRMAALGEMAAGIAHEIRNPLASMSGSAQILRKSLQIDDEEDELLDIVVRESRRLDDIIRDFLLFAKPRKFQPKPTDLVPVLRESLTLLRNSEEFTQEHRLKGDFDPDGVPALVDPDLVRQVFWNLARNALKAMPEGGTLTIRARRGGRGTVNVSFIDDGIGMNETEASHAFEPFHGSFGEGTGLGLAVVFRIVQEHKGSVRVNSRPGKGTDVTVTLPAAAVREPLVAAAAAGGAS